MKGLFVNPSTLRPKGLNLLSLPAPPSVGTGAGRQGLTLHFDKLGVPRFVEGSGAFYPALETVSQLK
jgi:hypothetical protein